MSIRSHPFGGVTLTGRDAKKFKAQITHGRPKAQAVTSIKRGVEMVRRMKRHGAAYLATGEKT